MKFFTKLEGNRLNICVLLVLNDMVSLMQIYGKLANLYRTVTEYSDKEQRSNFS